jgi:TRAP-type C4-dicarboxylate transport system permease small subunit
LEGGSGVKLKYPKALESLNTKLSIVSGAIIGVIGCFSIIEVICRGIFNSPTKWSADMNQYLLIWAIFFVSGFAFQAQGHVRVDILTRKMPLMVRRVMAVIAYCFCLAFILIITRSSILMFTKAVTQNIYTYAFLQIPRWILIVAMLMGCAIMIITLVSIIISIIGKSEKYL